eukprot:scaffold304525_cov51-Attheya_sp.AAC.1
MAMTPIRNNGQRTWRNSILVWMLLICVLVGKVCPAQFQIRQSQHHGGQTRMNNEAFGMQFVTGGADTPTISEKAGDILLQSSVLSSAELSPSPQSQIPENRIRDRKRHQRFRPRRKKLTPPPTSTDFKHVPAVPPSRPPPRTRPPGTLLTNFPTNVPTSCPSNDDGSIGDSTFREDDIIIRYSYEISLLENTEEVPEILTSITHHVMDIATTLVSPCDTVSGRLQLLQKEKYNRQKLLPGEEYNRQLQQKRRQLEVVGLSTSSAKFLDVMCTTVGGQVRLHVMKATSEDAANISALLTAIDAGVVRLLETNPQILQVILLSTRVEPGTTNSSTIPMLLAKPSIAPFPTEIPPSSAKPTISANQTDPPTQAPDDSEKGNPIEPPTDAPTNLKNNPATAPPTGIIVSSTSQSDVPSIVPSKVESVDPTVVPSVSPSTDPSMKPIVSPTVVPSGFPSPTNIHSDTPSVSQSPSDGPSNLPLLGVTITKQWTIE